MWQKVVKLKQIEITINKKQIKNFQKYHDLEKETE